MDNFSEFSMELLNFLLEWIRQWDFIKNCKTFSHWLGNVLKFLMEILSRNLNKQSGVFIENPKIREQTLMNLKIHFLLLPQV